jgi:hypothetical protein
MYQVNDYGPFLPGEIWHYRVMATSNSVNFQYKYLGVVTINTPSVVDWVSQVTSQIVTGNSPSTESSYTWSQESRDMHGISVSLMVTEISELYMEQNNCKIKAAPRPGSSL